MIRSASDTAPVDLLHKSIQAVVKPLDYRLLPDIITVTCSNVEPGSCAAVWLLMKQELCVLLRLIVVAGLTLESSRLEGGRKVINFQIYISRVVSARASITYNSVKITTK